MNPQRVVLMLCVTALVIAAARARDVVAAPQAVSDQAHVAWVGKVISKPYIEGPIRD